MTRRAFTLIELLIVIAIIAVLAAILFPMFGKAKESALETDELNNVKQLGTALSMYTDESDGRLPASTNYGVSTDKPERMWTNLLEPLVKSAQPFIAAGSRGQFADSWSKRSEATVGYNSATAIDKTQGCADDIANPSTCLAFKSAVSTDKIDGAQSALLAVTPGGALEDRYLGYEFSPYNGPSNPADEKLTPPLISDRDLVKELPAEMPAELMKPVYARYLSSGSDDGHTPVVFADSHVKAFSAKQIMSSASKIVWRLKP